LSDLTIKEPTPEVLMAFGDAALKLGQVAAAAGLYRAAMKRAEGLFLPLRARIGLTETPNNRTLNHLAALQTLETVEPRTAFVGDGLATWMKAPPFSRDRRFMSLAEHHANLLPAANWHWNLNTAAWAVQQARAVPGDFVELGVFKGHTTRFLADLLDFASWPKTWFLYDTFEGIPEDQLDAGWQEANARAYDGAYSVEEVRERFADLANIRIVQGRVPEVLAEESPETIAFLHVDLNNAAAEVQALDVLYERISPGGIILFDDFCWSVSMRQQTAELAWFEARGEHVLALPTGQGLHIKR
jgi:hypothetical protein